MRAHAEIDAQRHQSPFCVIADGGIGRVFVLTVILDPGIKAGLGHGLQESPWRLQNHVDGFVQKSEISGIVNQLGSSQKQVVVITGEAFKEPKQLRVVFLAIVVAFELSRTQLLDVPSVEIFVTDQA